jgi:enoyl-CoA hydratase/carnithine racemase
MVITGSDRAFAAGADIKEMASKSYAQVFTEDFITANWERVTRCRKPVIAAVAGYALGGGCELAMMCDFIIAADNARFGQPEINLGVIPGAGGTQRLTRLVGPSRAKSMVFTGRHVAAEEALALGIADRVVPDAGVYDAARELAAQYAHGPAVALRAAKQAVDDGLELDLDAGLRLETALFTGLFGTEDQSTGMASFMADGPGKATFAGR